MRKKEREGEEVGYFQANSKESNGVRGEDVDAHEVVEEEHDDGDGDHEHDDEAEVPLQNRLLHQEG